MANFATELIAQPGERSGKLGAERTRPSAACGGAFLPSVLVAEDDEEYRAYLRLTLAGGPYEVVEAADGDAAWGLLVRHRPAVAILDLAMPGRGGIDLVRAVRADPDLRRTYV